MNISEEWKIHSHFKLISRLRLITRRTKLSCRLQAFFIILTLFLPYIVCTVIYCGTECCLSVHTVLNIFTILTFLSTSQKEP